MNFQARLTLLVTGLLALAIVITAGVLGWTTRMALLHGAEISAERVAKLLARSAAFGSQVGRQLETVVGDMVVGQAQMASYYVAAAERAGMSVPEINAQLGALAGRSGAAEFWITDSAGHAYLHSVPDVDFSFDPDPVKQPQAHVFWPLLTGGAKAVVQEARRREIDDKVFKYVAVAGVDRPRIVEVGIDVGFLQDLTARLGLAGLVGALVGEGDINAIWVLNSGLDTLAHASLYGTDINPAPTAWEVPLVRRAMMTERAEPLLHGDTLTVAAPVRDGDRVVGAALVRLSTAHMDQALHRHLIASFVSALLVISLGTLGSVLLAKRATRPVQVMTQAARAMQRGEFDPASLNALTVRHDEFGTLGQVFQAMAHEVNTRTERLDALVKERTREIESKSSQLVAAHQRIDDELGVARSSQIAMLPQDFVQLSSHQLFGFTCPAREMGGDFYDHFSLDDDRVCLVVGDVSGKGVPAALFMVLAYSAVQAAMSSGLGPAEALRVVNERLIKVNPLELFVTMFVAVYHRSSGLLIFANAGHPPPYLIDQSGTVQPLARTAGMVAGMIDGLSFAEDRTVLRPGQVLFIYSDGFSEAMDDNGTLFGDDRLMDALGRGAQLSAQSLAIHAATAVELFAGKAEQADDLTCLVLRCIEVGTDTELRLELENRVEEISRAIAAIRTVCQQHGAEEEVLRGVHLAVDEALANVIHYAWSDGAPHQVHLRVSISGNHLTVEIRDDGMLFNPLAQTEPDLDAPIEERGIGGLGIYFIRSVMDEVNWRRDGGCNVLTMGKRLNSGRP